MSLSPTDDLRNRLLASVLENRRFSAYFPFMIGGYLDSIFLGLVLVVFVRWWMTVRATDKTWVKILVPVQVITSIAFSGVTLAYWFHLYVDGYGNYLALVRPAALRPIPALLALVRAPATGYFAVRAYILLGRPKWIPIVITPFILSTVVGGCVGTVAFTSVPPPRFFLNCILIFSGAGVASDVLITSCICYGLIKSKTGWAGTDSMINGLLLFVVETQMPPTLASIAFLVVSIVKGEGQMLGVFLFLPKVSTLCLILVVNSRVRLNEKLGGNTGAFTDPSKNSRGSGNGPYSSQTEKSPDEIDFIATALPKVAEPTEAVGVTSRTALV